LQAMAYQVHSAQTAEKFEEDYKEWASK